jgi:V8-like Glu-specific endopeptidase
MAIRTHPYVRFAVTAASLATLATLGTTTAVTASASGPAPVTHTVGAAAQSAAAHYWTSSRLASATGGAASSPIQNDTPTPPPNIPNPLHFNGLRTVGALFFTTGTQNHFCTASVVDSATLDLVLTAAHCVAQGNGVYAQNVVYVPEWHAGVSPFGAWPVQSITVTSAWDQSGNINDDFAFLKVGPPAGTHRPIQLVTGGLRLGSYVGYKHRDIHVIGYNNIDSVPIFCTTKSFYALPDQEEFYCNNYNDGTSGGPWILDLNLFTGSGIVFGDIGGYEQGGNYPWASYSPYYTATIEQLWWQAQGAQV